MFGILDGPRRAGPPTSGLAQWFDAGVGLNIGAGTWADRSGNGHDCTTTFGPLPTLNSSSVNGKPGVAFTGGNGFQGPSNPLANGSDREIFFVIKPTTSDAGLYACWHNSLPAWIADGRISGGSDRSVWDDGSGLVAKALGFSFSSGTGSVVAYRSTVGSLVAVTVNGTALTITGDTVVSDTGTAGFTIGGFYAGILGLVGDLCEVLLFDHVLSGGDRHQANVYLQNKYAISLGV